MGTKLFLIGILIASSVTAAYGFSVGSVNGALYFVGGPPDVSNRAPSFGTPQAGGYVNQHAEAYTPGGIGMVGQQAWAVGGQASGPGFQAQGFSGGMSQGALKIGGSGYVEGTQVGNVHMTQTDPTGTAFQSTQATGMQSSTIYGNPGGIGAASQSIYVSTTQIQVY